MKKSHLFATNILNYFYECLIDLEETKGNVASGIHVIVRPEGNSWKNITEKYLSHAKILENYVTNINPDPRWIFYTAQSYRDASVYDKSIEWYKKRAEMTNGFYEEIYISKFMIARLSEGIGKTKDECTMLYLDAHRCDPLRGEAVKSLVQMHHRNNDWENAYIFSLYGLRYNRNNPYPHRILFLDSGLYDFEMLELHSLSCYYTRRFEEGSKAYWMMRQQLQQMREGYLSEEQMKRVLDNEKYYPKPETFTKARTPQAPLPGSLKKAGSNFTPPKKKRKKRLS